MNDSISTIFFFHLIFYFAILNIIFIPDDFYYIAVLKAACFSLAWHVLFFSLFVFGANSIHFMRSILLLRVPNWCSGLIADMTPLFTDGDGGVKQAIAPLWLLNM